MDELIHVPEAEKAVIRDFYSEVISTFGRERVSEMKQNVQFIVVGHLQATLPFYLEALDRIGTVAVVIAKGSVADPDIEKWLDDSHIATRVMTPTKFEKFKNKMKKEDRGRFEVAFRCMSAQERERRRLPDELDWNKLSIRELLAVDASSFLSLFTPQLAQKIVIDIGGYFCHALRDRAPILGYVEDMENGFQKYQAVKEFASPDIPLISVARSLIKDSEDYNVGKAITDATDHILRITAYTHLAEPMTILVIGFGKIGSAAAMVATEKTRCPVLVCEKDPVRKLKASALSFKVVDLNEGLKLADVVSCCTGEECLRDKHVGLLRHNVYIASCTSRDDEFSPSFWQQLEKVADQRIPEVVMYQSQGKLINMLNNGDSVNFVQKAVHGYFIHGVLASLVVSAMKIFCEKQDLRSTFTDFNDVTFRALQGRGTCQSIISEILMKHKLRKEPFINNVSHKATRRMSRAEALAKVKEAFESQHRIVCVVGGKKSGKTQVVEEYYSLHKARYDIVWSFDQSDLEFQFRYLAQAINDAIDEEKLSERKIDMESQGQFSLKVGRFLSLNAVPYLLIFEQLDLTIVRDAIPERSGLKREQILLTCDPTMFGNTTEKMDAVVQLQPFPERELLQYLVNDAAVWKELSSCWNGLLYFLQSSDALDALPLAATWICVERARGRDIGEIVGELLKHQNKSHLFKMVIQSLSRPAVKLLRLFRALAGKNKIDVVIPCSAIESYSKSIAGSSQLIKELVDVGLIEKSDALYALRYSDIELTCSHSELTFATNHVVKQFCRDRGKFQYSRLTKLAEQIAEESNETYQTWRAENSVLYEKLLRRLGWFYAPVQPKIARGYLVRALDLWRSFDLPPRKQAKRVHAIGSFYARTMEWDLASESLQKALEIYEKLPEIDQKLPETKIEVAKVKARLLGSLSCTRKSVLLPTTAQYGEEALAVFEQEGFDYWTGFTHMWMGIWHKENRQFDKAGKCYQESAKLFKKIEVELPDPLLQNFGVIRKNQGLHAAALKVFQEKLNRVNLREGKCLSYCWKSGNVMTDWANSSLPFRIWKPVKRCCQKTTSSLLLFEPALVVS